MMMNMKSRRTAIFVTLMSAALITLPACGKTKGKKPVTMGERISVLDYEREVQASAELQGVEVVLPAAQVNAEWDQPGGNSAKSMGNLALAAQPSRLWTASIGRGSDATRRLNATPVVSANRLFTIDTEGQVSAFEADTGRKLWEVTLGLKNEGGRPAFGGGVSVSGERVYVTTGLGEVAALEAATGKQLWRIRRPTPLRGAPSVDQQRLFVVSIDGQLTSLSTETGEELWIANATVEPAAIMGPGAPAVSLDTVVAGFASGELFALRVENGRTSWQDQLSRTGRTTALGALAGIAASPVIDKGRVFAIGHGGRMVALELATGQRVWEREFAGVNTPWPAGDWIFTVTVEAELVALSRADGKIRWVTDLGRWKKEKSKKGAVEWFGPILAGDQLRLVSSLGKMVTVSPATGEIINTTKLQGPAYLPPIVANGILYILTDDGKISAYR